MTWGGVIKHKKIIIFSVLIIVAILSIVVINNVTNKSYAAVTYLYDKVKTDATTNGYGGTYSGDHADSVQSDGTEIVGNKAIYYYSTAGYNNVHFAGFCWQIIRTTDTGGVKLLYNGAYSSSKKCNNSGTARQLSSTSMFNILFSNAKYVGYKYNDSSNNDTDSNVKKAIDNWYSSNMTSYTSQLEDTVFCNDRTGSPDSSSAATGTTWRGSGSGTFYYHNYDGTYNKLSCDNVKDRFTTNNSEAQLTYPVALATKPEVLLMDSTTKNTGQWWWLLSPFDYESGTANERRVNTSGVSNGYRVYDSGGVRPVVSLVPFMTYIGGNGSVSSPYEIGEVQLPERTSSSYMYDIIEQDATEYGWGGTYAGEHADTVEDDGTAIVGDENIYYYKKAGYNNVKLGELCWQIIRTTDTGGVKLIYNGTYSSSKKCNNSGDAQQIRLDNSFNGSTYNNAKYVGLKYKTTNDNDTNSLMLSYLNTLYEEYLLNYESYLEDTVFCNDRTGSTNSSSAATGTTWRGEGTSNFYYHNYDKTYNKLSCYDYRDRFTTNNTSAQLSYPIGLMSQPEYLLGGAADTTNVHYTGSSYWLISPERCNGSAMVGYVTLNGTLSNSYTYPSRGVRPSVSLAPGIKYSSGTGTKDNPYVIAAPSQTFTATFYYQSNVTSGSTSISSVTASCETTEDSCSAEIPSAVRSSVGTYNNSYAGLNTSTGSMSTPVNSSATTVTLTSDTTYYAVYRSSVTNYYYE